MTGLALALPRRRSVATLSGFVAVLACVAAVAIGLASGESTGSSPYLVVDVVQGLVFPVVALAVVMGRPRHPAGWLLLVIGAGHAASVFAGGWHVAARPGSLFALWLESWVWFLGFAPLVGLLPLVVPDGIPSGRRRLLWRIAVTAVATSTVALALVGRLDTGPHTSVPNPVGLPGAAAAFPALLLLDGLVSLVVLADLVRRWRRADEPERRSLLPVVTGFLLVGVALIASTVLPASEPLLQALSLPMVALGIAVGVLRHHLFDIEVVIRRSLTYGLVTAALLLLYLSVAYATDALLAERARLAGSVLATGLVAVAFSPVRSLAQRLVSRTLFGDRDDPGAALSRLMTRLAGTAPPGQVLQGVAETIAHSLRLPYAALLDPAGEVLAAAGVRPAGELITFPMAAAAAGEGQEGEVAVGRRSPAESLSRADEALLADLAAVCAVAVRADRLSREIQQSRERLVAAREEERRRLRRDLHDELGPALASVRVQLDVAQMLLGSAPGQVPTLLAEARGTAGRAVEDLRGVIAGLRPPALDDIGLLESVRDLGRRLSGAGTEIAVVGDALPGLPAAVEVAAYRIAAEALNNAVRHADAASVQVTLCVDASDLTMTVVDDGVGLPEHRRSGIGVRSMAERAEELGGRLSIEPAHAGDRPGVRVSALLPLVAP